MAKEDWHRDRGARAWLKAVLTDMAPKMDESAYVMQLVPSGKHSEGDVKFWVELGASIMMDKPILAIMEEGQQVPEKLKLVADRIVRIPPGPHGDEAKRRIEQGIRQMHADLDATGH